MDALRNLPKVDVLAASPELAAFPFQVRVLSARQAIAETRDALQRGSQPDDLMDRAVALALRNAVPGLPTLINMSGVVLHTGAGRARLAPYAGSAIEAAAVSHSAVEMDLESGARGNRQSHVKDLLCRLTGANDALVVNNCAAAVHLVLSALCAGRDVILSRGEMVEIGGAVRKPEKGQANGCRLVEGGCTNKTHPSDYFKAISSETSAILRCHRSNFKIIGFTDSPSGSELAQLSKEKSVQFIEDLGSGCLVDTSPFGLPKQRTVQDAVSDGADLVLFSGDKLLGGPQCGIIVGRDLGEIAAHPLARAFRVDKLTLAGLRATLQLYDWGQHDDIPTIRYLARSLEDVRALAEHVATGVRGANIELGETEIGGGSAPGDTLPTWRVGFDDERGLLAQRLRVASPHILGRVENGRFWLDPRTIEPTEAAVVNERLQWMITNVSSE